MVYYCRAHPDFEGLDMGKFHDHLEKEHKNDFFGARDAEEYRERLKALVQANIEVTHDAIDRRTDWSRIRQTWGRPPKLGSDVAENETEN